MIDRQLVRLEGRLEDVETVSGKVSKTSDDWPYIEEHMTVRMAEPRAATAIKDKIREKKARRKKIQGEIWQVEKFIKGLTGRYRATDPGDGLPGGNEPERTLRSSTGYSYGRISQIIKRAIKD